MEGTASPLTSLHEAMDIDEAVGDNTAKEDGEAGAGLRKSTTTTIGFTDSDSDEDEDMDAPASERAPSPAHAGLGGRRGRKMPASFNNDREDSPAGPSNPWRGRSPTLSPRAGGRRNRRKPHKANRGHLVGGVVKNAVRMGLSMANDITNNFLGQALGAAAMATGAGSAAAEPGSPTSESSGEEGPLSDGEPDVAFVGERSGPSDPVQDFSSWEKEFEAGRKAVAAARAKARTWATGVFAEEGEDVVDLTH